MNSESILLIACDAALRGALIASLLLLAVGLLRAHAGSLMARCWIALALGLSIQTFASAPEVEQQLGALWQAPLVAISVGNGVVFWVFSRALFDDDFRPGWPHVLLWCVVAAASGVNCGFGSHLAGPMHRLLELVQRATPLLCAVLVLVAAGSHWAEDLVERRRSLRAFIIVGGVLYSLAQLFLRLSSAGGTLTPALGLVDTSMLLLLVAGVAARALIIDSPELLGPVRLASSQLLARAEVEAVLGKSEAAPATATATANFDYTDPAAGSAPPEPNLDAERLLSEHILSRMQQERLFAQPDLTVAGLASALALPEYRLRHTINRALGFRNFNAFVNSYRLSEAIAALADRKCQHLPILSIALNTGFQSIGPFNRAFKASTGVTPSEYREKLRAENANPLAESSN